MKEARQTLANDLFIRHSCFVIRHLCHCGKPPHGASGIVGEFLRNRSLLLSTKVGKFCKP